MKRFFFLTLILFISFFRASAQTEGATWASVKIQKNLGEKFEIALEPQLRTSDSELEKRIIETSFGYKPLKYLSLEVIHRYTKETTKNGWANSNRMAFDITGKVDIDRWEPSARLRYTNLKDFNEDGGANFLRYKLSLGYDIKGFKLNPEISVEAFQETEGNTLRKMRYEVGTSYKINKMHSVSLAYKRDDFETKQKYVNIVDMSYKLKL